MKNVHYYERKLNIYEKCSLLILDEKEQYRCYREDIADTLVSTLAPSC